MVSNEDPGSLPIASDAKVYSCFLQKGKTVAYPFKEGYGGYLYAVEGGSVSVNGQTLHHLDAAMIRQTAELSITAEDEAELLLVVVPLQ